MEVVWKCFPALSPRPFAGGGGAPAPVPGGTPVLRQGVRVRAPTQGPGEEVGDARGTPALQSSAGGYGAGDFSLGVGWSITSSRRLSVGMTVLLAPPGKASGEVDTLSWKSPTKKQPPDKRHREACPEPPCPRNRSGTGACGCRVQWRRGGQIRGVQDPSRVLDGRGRALAAGQPPPARPGAVSVQQ